MQQLRLQLPAFISMPIDQVDRVGFKESTIGNPCDSESQLLTPRRRQVLARYLRGESRMEIAQQLGVSPNTVRNHIRLVYEDLGLTNRVEALRWALEQPSMAHRLLSEDSASSQADPAIHKQDMNGTPATIEDMIDEAVSFFRQCVVNSPLESA